MEILLDKARVKELIPIKIIDVIAEAQDTYTYRCQPDRKLTWEAGANTHLVMPEIKTVSSVEKDWRRHMSIMSTPEDGYMGFTTRIREQSSLFKTSMRNCMPGDKVHIYGIRNNFPLVRSGNPVIMLSMGVGMATMRPLIKSYQLNPKGISSLTSLNVDRGSNGVYQEEMEALDLPGFFQHYREDRKSFLDQVDQCLEMKDALFYLVGSDEFLSSMAYYLVGSGVPKTMLRIDKKPHKVQTILDAI